MRLSCVLGMLAACVCSTGAVAAESGFLVSPKIDYANAEAKASLGPGCAWEAQVQENLIKFGNGRLISADKAGEGKQLQVAVIELDMPATDGKRKVQLKMRANVMDRGVLIATRDFSKDNKFPANKNNCVALSELGKEMGEDIADWVTSEKMPVCGEGCTGIHPNAPIFVGDIAEGDPDTISDEVKKECKWNDYMLNRLVSDFNAQKPAPMFQLKRGMGDEKSRRLELTVTALHTIGGGSITGPKWLAMAGKLYDGKMLVGSFSFKHSSNGFLTMNMCSPLAKLSNEMSETISDWLNEPSIGAEL